LAPEVPKELIKRAVDSVFEEIEEVLEIKLKKKNNSKNKIFLLFHQI
jgi:hypothetical protein